MRASTWRMVGAVFCAVFIVYFPALRGGFLWDDAAHVTAPGLRSWAGLWRIWFEVGATQQYYPFLHSAFWLEHRAWGDSVIGYHLTNATLHATAACLAGLLLRRLRLPGAFLAALIFALHPVHVESVAWITEQKNTLSAVFYLCAALVYVQFDASRKGPLYLLASALFVFGLLTKTVVATLPAALLVVFWWQRGRLSWSRDVRPLFPWFALAVIAGLFTAWIERRLIGAEGAAFDLTLLQRGLLAGHVVWFYLGKLCWPADLIFIYPRWSIDSSRVAPWLPLVAAFGMILLLWHFRGRSRGPLAACLFFAGSLFPVLGFFNVYPFIYSFVADHFQYLSSLGVIALASAGLARLVPAAPRFGGMLSAILVVSLGGLTWRQCHTYRDAQTLWRTTISRNPYCWMAHNNLGKELMTDKSTLSEAIECFEAALRLRPAYPEAENNLGLALTQTGRPGEAIPHLTASLRLKPGSYQTHNNLGIALASSGRAEEALRSFAQAAALNPKLANIQENWAKALALLGRHAEAAEHFAAAARLRAPPP